MPPLYQQIYQHILEEIRSGRLSSGDRVPSEKELAEQFNVSRITSKKALETLVQVNVIERARGKGSFVAHDLPDLAHLEGLPHERPNHLDEESASDHLIGVVVPDFADSYGVYMLRAIEQRCAERGLFMVLKMTRGSREVEESVIRELVDLGVEGLVIFPVHGEYYNATLLRLVLGNFPTVIVDRYLKGIPAQAVFTDNEQAALELTQYLFNLGHSRIAFLSPPPENTSTIEDRLRGFSEAFTRQGLPVRSEYHLDTLTSTLPGAFSPENIENDCDTIRSFIVAHPEITAFVACEYNLALVLRHALHSMGKHIPEDYSVACFDDPSIDLNSFVFTHIEQNETLMGTTAIDLLIQQIEGNTTPTSRTVEFQLVEGMSTKSRS